MMVFLTLAAALLPTFFLVRYFVRNDAYPEPTPLIALAFLLGVIIVAPVAWVEYQIRPLVDSFADPYARGSLRALLVAALPEEGIKFLVVAGICSRWKAFNEPMDGVVYGATASLGFATLENLLFAMHGGLGVTLVRALTAVPAHACFGAIMGYGIARALFSSQPKLRNLFWALLAPLLLHALYDMPLLIVDAVGRDQVGLGEIALAVLTVPGVVIGSIAWLYQRLRTLRTEQLGLPAAG